MKNNNKDSKWVNKTIAIGAIIAVFISSITLYVQRKHNILISAKLRGNNKISG